MDGRYIIHLYKFRVQAIDRRDTSEREIYIVLPYPVTVPEDLEDCRDTIRAELGNLGYAIAQGGIEFIGQQTIGIDLPGAYDGQLSKAVKIIHEGEI